MFQATTVNANYSSGQRSISTSCHEEIADMIKYERGQLRVNLSLDLERLRKRAEVEDVKIWEPDPDQSATTFSLTGVLVRVDEFFLDIKTDSYLPGDLVAQITQCSVPLIHSERMLSIPIAVIWNGFVSIEANNSLPERSSAKFRISKGRIAKI